MKKVTKQLAEKENINIQVVERAGKSVKEILPGLKSEQNCGRNDCLVHQFRGKGDCNIEGIVYQIQCLKCKEQNINSLYIGESSRSAYVRGKQHLEAAKKPNIKGHESNALAKHLIEYHEGRGDRSAFRMDVMDSFKRPLQRQLREGIEIVRCEADRVMNSKSDYHQLGIRRVVFAEELDT